jgi:sarcosine oxidase subunit alpha
VNAPAPNPFRLAGDAQIDRHEPLRFTFNGTRYVGFRGDTLASALLANGVRVVARSFKYHRPRGIFSAGEEEPCALVETGAGNARVPNCRATVIPLEEGLVASSQNGWPTVNFDLGRAVDFTHPLWPAGFYNKTFKWPSWKTWEPLVRHSTGLGRPLDGPDPDHYEQVNAHCDLLICGGGPAGLMAALVAAEAGLRVILAEQGPQCGGVLNHENVELEEQPGRHWASQAAARLRDRSNVILLENTVAAGVYDHNVTTLLQTGQGTAWRECLWTVRPGHILLASGAIEQGLIFPNNDRPGIMLAGAVRHYLNRYAVLPGRKVVIATNNDSAYQTVFDLVQREVPVTAVVDSRETISPALEKRLRMAGTELLRGARISDTRGFSGLRSVRIAGPDDADLGRRDCDLLAVSGGWSPRAHLLAHARGSLRFDEPSQSFVPDRLPTAWSVTGAASGVQNLQRTLEGAASAASRISERLGRHASGPRIPRVTRGPVEPASTDAQKPAASRRRQWIDLAHDVTVKDAELAVREGFVSVEHFKRYTTTGMSVDQGKTGNLNAFVVLGALTGRATGEVGTTTFRPPYVPVTLGAIAGIRNGEFYAPRRLLPAHLVHQKLGGLFEDYGWQRPDAYPRPGESLQDAVRREVITVRSAVGVFDNSPIGKLEVRGPDAARFLDRVYINNVSGLPVGRARYGLMLNENGVIVDDGVFLRLAEDHFLLNTTSGAAGRIAAMLEEWLQCEWTDLRVLVDDLTVQSCCFTIAGPRAPDVVYALGTDLDLSPAALPHMAAVSGAVGGLPARLARVSFSGELSYEISMPARHASALLEAILTAGEPFGIEPYGIESLMVLRAEKGFLHVGTDTDGSSTPDDVGWGEVARRKAGDFIGKRSLERPANRDTNRKQFVGLEPLDPGRQMRPGGHLLIGADRRAPALTDGWVTSACHSPTLDRPIALGLLRGGRSRLGEIVTVCDEQRAFNVKVVSPVFYDPTNARLEL